MCYTRKNNRTVVLSLALAVLGAAMPSWAQVPGQVAPSSHFTWADLLERERKQPPVRVPGVPAPAHEWPGSKRMVAGAESKLEPPKALDEEVLQPQAFCPGFANLPYHSVSFQGLGDDNTSWPPDTMGAVGPRHVVTMLNTQVRIQNRIGTVNYSTVSLGTFWGGLSGPFDPKIYYDNLTGRWIAVCMGSPKSANSNWAISISQTPDPTGSWTSYTMDGDGANTLWADYPCVGFNDKWVAATFNMFPVPGVMPAPTKGPKMVVINKPDLLAGGTVTTFTFDVGFDGINAFSLQPAVSLEANNEDLYILDHSGYTGNPNNNTNLLRLSRLTGAAGAPTWSALPGSIYTTAGFFAVQNRFSNALMGGAQANSSTPLDPGNTGMCNVVQRNGSIWAVHTGAFPADAPDRNAIFWYQLQPSLPDPIVQSGLAHTGGPGGGYTFPSIAVNCGNDACIGFSSTSAAISPSACYIVRLAGDPPGSTSSTSYIRDGRAKYVKMDTNTPPRNRWGDYSATVVDPLDDKTFWTLQEYSELPSAGSDRFGVQWAQITDGCPTPGITQHPQSQDICLGQPVTFSVGVNEVSVAQYQWNKNGQPIMGATFYNYTIPSVAAAYAGQYTCTVIGLCATATSNPATLNVVTAPVVTGFIAWPNATCPGTNASIIPALPDSGANPIAVTLQKLNGAVWQDMPGRTIAPGDAFDFTPLVKVDTGDYRLKYANVCGSVYSDQHRLQVGVTFDQHPASQSKSPCESASFTVVARGVGTLTYQWRHNGAPMVNDGRIFGVDTLGLTIVGVRFEDEGTYDCLVSDDCETLLCNPAQLTLPTPTWVQRSPQNAPVKRGGTAMAYDANRQVAVLYGGFGPYGVVSDTWEWDGTNWTQRALPLTAGRRLYHAMTYDSDRKVIVLYGGQAGGVFESDLWEYDGQAWTLRAPSNAPGGPPSYVVSSSPIAYDSLRRKIVMVRNNVSGATGNTHTWEFDQPTGNWNLRVASNNFPGAYGDVLGFDPIRNVSVHYYASASYDGYKASYRWNGSTWTPDPPTAANLAWTNIAYDTTRRRLVIFGGNPGSSLYQTDSFFDTGSGWAVLLPPGPPSSPPIRTSDPIAMAYDSHRRAMVSVLNPYYGDYYGPLETWEYRYLDRIVFDRHPLGQPLTPGATANFTAYAAGYGTLSYQWKRNGQNIANGPAPGGGTLAGATTATLTLTGVQTADNAAYACLVSNTCGSVLSSAALLGTLPMDFDGDNDVDNADLAAFEACAGGAAVPVAPPCQAKDLDSDGDVDQSDFGIFQRCYSGENVPADPNCTN